MLSERLTDLIEPVVRDLGFELVLLEFNAQKGHGGLRLFIDGPDGITLEHCERVSREVAALLDVEDAIPHAYRLEVSSPGLDRPLVKPEHYQRFQGETAKVQMIAPVNGRRRFSGVIVESDERAVTLDCEEGRVVLPLSDVERARLVPDYERGTKAS